jgi:hypothetical protein
MLVPFSVNCVAPEEPVRTSTEVVPWNVSDLPASSTRPLWGPTSLPSTQTLIQAGLPLTFTTRLTPLTATSTFIERVAVLPSADVAVTVTDQRPAVSSSGGKENEPSVATSIVVPDDAPPAPGTLVGVGDAAGAPAPLPRKLATTETVFALVVVPSTAIAPLPYFVPSTGAVTVSVGAWISRKGTVITTVRGVSAALPVSGFTALPSKRFWPRRRSTCRL